MLILCNNVEILQVLGKCLFTVFLRDTNTMESLMKTHLLNEVIQLALFDDNMNLKMQCKPFLIFLLTSSRYEYSVFDDYL